MRVLIAAAGEVTMTEELTALIADAEVVIAADAGLEHCAAAGRWPNAVVGDLDSADAELVEQARRAGVDVHSFDADKDETDLELAFDIALTHDPAEVIVVGVFGGRVDHQLANVALLAADRWPCRVRAADGDRDMWVVHGRNHSALDLRLEPGTTITLLPWNGDAVGVSSTGVRWPLVGETLTSGSPRGVSNICNEPHQRISIESGSLLVVRV